MAVIWKSLILIVSFLGILNLKFTDADRNASHALLDEVIQRYWFWKLHAFPELATEMGVHRYDHELTSYTQEQFLDNRDKCERLLLKLDNVNETELDKEDMTNFQIIKGELSQYVKGYEWRNYGALNPINFMEGIHRQQNPKVMLFSDEGDFNVYASRMARFPARVDEVIELMRQAIQLNRTNHKLSMQRVHLQIKSVHRAAKKSMWYWPYANRLPYIRMAGKKKTLLMEQAVGIIEREINPAYERLQKFIKNEYMPHTRKTHGVWSWNNGVEYYEQCLHFYIGKNMSIEEVHNTGLEERERINNLMKQIVEEWGYNGTLREFFEHLRSKHRAEFFDKTPIMLLNEFEEILAERINPKLDTIVKHVPETATQIRVKHMNEDGPPGMYRDNEFLVNLKHPRKRSTFDMMALTLHEANPGHHFQASYANNLSLPDFRRAGKVGGNYGGPFNFPSYDAYNEGWAMYAQYLGEEMGVYNKTALELLGRYSWEMIGALRLVVDTGIHALKMTRREAIEMMLNYTAMPKFQVQLEIDRYITWPGQACAYKVGEMTLQEWRNEAKERIGDEFDIRDFNEAVLSTGKAPLEVTHAVVADYIDDNEPAPSGSSSIILPSFFILTLSLLRFML